MRVYVPHQQIFPFMAALGDAAAVRGAGEVEVVTQYPEHGRGGVNVHRLFFAVDV